MAEDTNGTTRRELIRKGSWAALAMTAAGGSVADIAHAEWTPGPWLLLDHGLVASTDGLVREVVPPTRLPEPIVTGSGDGCFQPYLTVIPNAATRRFRIWYGTPRTPQNASETSIATMESTDGIHWVRPHRVLADPGRIQFGSSVLDEGPGFRDPSRRYKLAWWYGGGLRIAASPDGLTWTPLSDQVVLQTNHDITGIDWDPIRKRYIAFVSFVPARSRWAGLRIPHQSMSDDLLHWKAPWPIVTPDKRSPIEQGETQFYGMSAMLRRGELLVSMVKVLRDDLNCEPGKTAAELHDPGRPFAGIGYTVVAWSRDGVTWSRETVPFLDRNATPGTWDRAMAWIDDQVPVGDHVYLYYGGYRWGHKAERFTGRQIGLAQMLRDRYAAYTAAETGRLLTVFRRLGDVRRMSVNAAVGPGGEVRAKVLGPPGAALSGFDWQDCRPVTGDHLDAGISWRGKLSELAGELVRFEFRVRRGRLFAFTLGGPEPAV